MKPNTLDIVKHEVGHWLAWKLLGGKVGSIEITDNAYLGPKGAANIFLDWDIKNLDDAIVFTESRIITLWCGIYAQAFDGEKYDADLIKNEFNHGGGARLDWVKASEYILFLKNILTWQTQEEMHYRLDQKAANLVADNFQVISDIATKLSALVVEKNKLYIFNEKQIVGMLG